MHSRVNIRFIPHSRPLWSCATDQLPIGIGITQPECVTAMPPMRRAGASPPHPHPSAAALSSTTSKGTPGSSLAQRITSEVLTEATFGAAVRLLVRKR